MLALQVKGKVQLKFLSRSLYTVKNYHLQKCKNSIKSAVGLSYYDVNEKLIFQLSSKLFCPRQLFHSSHYLADNNKDSFHSKSDSKEDSALNKVKVDPSRLSKDGYETLYSFGSIVLYQVVSRLKIYQSVGTIGLLVASLYTSNNETLFDAALLGFGVSSSIILLGLFTASAYIKKIVGLIAINNTGDHVKLAHISYWGKRKNVFIPIDNLVLPLPFDGKKYVIHLKNSQDIFYLIPSKANYYNSFLMDTVFGKLG